MSETVPLYESSTLNEELALAPDGCGYHFLVTPLWGGCEVGFVLSEGVAADSTIRYLERRGHTLKVIPLALEPRDDNFFENILGL